MNDQLKKYEELKERLEKSRRKLDQITGAQRQLMGRLRKEFHCKTLEDASKLLKSLQKRKMQLETDLESSIAKFEKRWQHVLNNGTSEKV